MTQITTAFWGMTINNYDDTDLAMVQNGYPDYLREIVHTLEVGEEGTPHIQAWIKLQRQQRLSFVKKLFPRGHFKPLTSDQYVHNTKCYAQKLDETAVSAVVHKFNDPKHSVENVMVKVIDKMFHGLEDMEDATHQSRRLMAQTLLVLEDYKYAKIFVSMVYKQMWAQYGDAMVQHFFDKWRTAREKERAERLEHTHTHTHTPRK